MKEKSKTFPKGKVDAATDYGRHAGNESEEVLNLDELFDVQGGVEDTEEQEHMEENCGLGCYTGGGNIVINSKNGQR